MNMMDDQVLLLDSLGIDSIIVFGHSDGGSIGLLMPIHHPEKIIKLITAGSNLLIVPDASHEALIEKQEFVFTAVFDFINK